MTEIMVHPTGFEPVASAFGEHTKDNLPSDLPSPTRSETQNVSGIDAGSTDVARTPPADWTTPFADLGWGKSPPRCIQALRDGRTYVYLIAGVGTPVKIGMSNAPYERLATLQTAHWVQLELLVRIEGGLALEAALHERFATCRMVGEWFDRTPEIDAFIAEAREQHGTPAPFHIPAVDTRPASRRTPAIAYLERTKVAA